MIPDTDWEDPYSGNVDNIGVNPYSLSSQSPQVTQSQGNNPLAGLANALQGMNQNQGYTVAVPQLDTGASGYGSDINLPQPDYTDPAAALGW